LLVVSQGTNDEDFDMHDRLVSHCGTVDFWLHCITIHNFRGLR
jgi:hypothetical protein